MRALAHLWQWWQWWGTHIAKTHMCLCEWREVHVQRLHMRAVRAGATRWRVQRDRPGVCLSERTQLSACYSLNNLRSQRSQRAMYTALDLT